VWAQHFLNGTMRSFEFTDAESPHGAAIRDLAVESKIPPDLRVCRWRELEQLARLAAPIVITMMSHQGMVITDQVRAQSNQACQHARHDSLKEFICASFHHR
jgi:hypothetical protein